MTSKDFRIEKDSLGEVKVPATALYGAQTQRAVENFPISGLRPWRAFIWSIAAVKRAAALVNFDWIVVTVGSVSLIAYLYEVPAPLVILISGIIGTFIFR